MDISDNSKEGKVSAIKPNTSYIPRHTLSVECWLGTMMGRLVFGLMAALTFPSLELSNMVLSINLPSWKAVG